MWEQQQLGTVENVVAELRNHKRKLQALLQFDPHATLQDLYRLQGMSFSSLADSSFVQTESSVVHGGATVLSCVLALMQLEGPWTNRSRRRTSGAQWFSASSVGMEALVCIS